MLNGRLFIPQRAAKRELTDRAARDEIIAAWRKNLFARLPAKGVSGCRLIKAYVTTARGPRRTLYLNEDASGDTIFLFHRPEDDPLGDNMAYANPAFEIALDKAIRAATEDIQAGRVDVIER